MRSSFAALPAVALLIFSLAIGRDVISNLLASRPAVFLGDISYSLYMTHMIVLEICFLPLDYTCCGAPAGRVVHGLWLLASIAIVAVATLWTYRHIEQPARIYLRRLAGR